MHDVLLVADPVGLIGVRLAFALVRWAFALLSGGVEAVQPGCSLITRPTDGPNSGDDHKLFSIIIDADTSMLVHRFTTLIKSLCDDL